MKSIIKLILKDPFFMFKKWGIGLDVENKNRLPNQFNNLIWITGTKAGDYYADPFLTKYFGEDILFFEKWDDTKYQGDISWVSVDNIIHNSKNLENYVKTAIDWPSHLSYPCLFEYDNKLYMVPENHQANMIPLFVAGSTPSEWNYLGPLIPEFPGSDSTIFEYEGKWWLFSTLKNNELYIWYSDTPLGKWKQHPESPVIYAEEVARCAGLFFIHNNKLYRPVQDCRKIYGNKLMINEITSLSESNFSEKCVGSYVGIKPYDKAYHTYNRLENRVVIDGKKYDINIKHIYFVMKHYLHRD